MHDQDISFCMIFCVISVCCTNFHISLFDFFKQSVPALPLDAESQNPGTNYNIIYLLLPKFCLSISACVSLFAFQCSKT